MSTLMHSSSNLDTHTLWLIIQMHRHTVLLQMVALEKRFIINCQPLPTERNTFSCFPESQLGAAFNHIQERIVLRMREHFKLI